MCRFSWEALALGVGAVLLGSGCAGGSDVFAPCEPYAGAVHWVTEGESVVVALSCEAEGSRLAERRVQFTALPAGALYDAASATLSWTPQLHHAALHELELVLPDSAERSHVRIGVLDAHLHPENEPVQDPSAYPEEYGLPVLFVDRAPAAAEYEDVTLTFRGRTYHAEAKLRGSSSLDYPKKNYTLKFENGDLFQAPELGPGFSDRKKVVLISTFDDNSYVRPRLAFDLWNAMDPEHIQIHAAHVVVYTAGHYHGLYTLADHVDRHLMRAHGMHGDGNLYKFSTYAADLRVKDPIHAGVEKPEGKPEDDFSDLAELVTFVDTASEEDFAARLQERIDVRDYRDWWGLVTTIRAEDSASKNSYHYLERAGAPARFAPWDFNASFGQSWTTTRLAASEVRTYTSWNRLFERWLADADAAEALLARRAALLDGVFHPDHVDALIDGYIAEVAPGMERDWAIWRDRHQRFGRWSSRADFTTIEEELEYLRAWYRERWAVLKVAHVPEPSPAAPEPGPGSDRGSGAAQGSFDDGEEP